MFWHSSCCEDESWLHTLWFQQCPKSRCCFCVHVAPNRGFTEALLLPSSILRSVFNLRNQTPVHQFVSEPKHARRVCGLTVLAMFLSSFLVSLDFTRFCVRSNFPNSTFSSPSISPFNLYPKCLTLCVLARRNL